MEEALDQLFRLRSDRNGRSTAELYFYIEGNEARSDTVRLKALETVDQAIAKLRS